MASSVHVPGISYVQVGVAGSGTLQAYGTSRNGVDIRFDAHCQDVPNDEFGGEAGPPCEVLYHGETAEVRIEFTKFDAAVHAAVVANRMATATAGSPGGPGVLMFTNKNYCTLVINNANTPYTFPRAICRQPVENPGRGSSFERWVVTFTCYKNDSGSLFTN